MNNLAYIFIILFIGLSKIGLAQEDTTYAFSLSMTYSSGKVIENEVDISEVRVDGSVSKSNLAVVAFISQKSLFERRGLQYGADVYAKFKWGYMRGGLSFSKFEFFPSGSLLADAHVKLLKGLTCKAGLQFLAYQNGSHRINITFGPTFYYRSLMGLYNAQLPSSGSLSHKFIFRKYIGDSKDFLQAGYYQGVVNDVSRVVFLNDVNIQTFSIFVQRTVFERTQVIASCQLVKASDQEINKQTMGFSVGLKRKF